MIKYFIKLKLLYVNSKLRIGVANYLWKNGSNVLETHTMDSLIERYTCVKRTFRAAWAERWLIRLFSPWKSIHYSLSVPNRTFQWLHTSPWLESAEQNKGFFSEKSKSRRLFFIFLFPAPLLILAVLYICVSVNNARRAPVNKLHASEKCLSVPWC